LSDAQRAAAFAFQIDEGSTSLQVDLAIVGVASHHRGVSLFLFNCTSGRCLLNSAFPGNGNVLEAVVRNPVPGLWKVIADYGATNVPKPLTYRLTIAITHPRHGNVTVDGNDKEQPLLAGAKCPVVLSVRTFDQRSDLVVIAELVEGDSKAHEPPGDNIQTVQGYARSAQRPVSLSNRIMIPIAPAAAAGTDSMVRRR
jgi:hypothetical protein